MCSSDFRWKERRIGRCTQLAYSKISDGIHLKASQITRKKKRGAYTNQHEASPRERMRRKDAFIHSLQNGHGRYREKYLHSVQALPLASTQKLR